MKKFILYSLFFILCVPLAHAVGVQEAWDNPNANMARESVKPGYAQLTWEAGGVLPIKLRNGMVTMVNLPTGEEIADGVVGNQGLFDFDPQGNAMFITPVGSNQGADTNLIVTGKSGNKYIFYLRSEPANSSEITYSQVDIVLDGNKTISGATTNTQYAGMKPRHGQPLSA